jgi:hypothetical protein
MFLQPCSPSLSPLQYRATHVVCKHLSLRQSLYKSDAYGHDPKQPPGMTVESGSLSPLRP